MRHRLSCSYTSYWRKEDIGQQQYLYDINPEDDVLLIMNAADGYLRMKKSVNVTEQIASKAKILY